MRVRWTYIQPQVKHLQREESIYAPTGNVRCVITGERDKRQGQRSVDYTVLNGNVVDTNYYHAARDRISHRDRLIKEKTCDLKQIEIDKNKSYTYSHAVRY